jgi:hypothetical protein
MTNPQAAAADSQAAQFELPNRAQTPAPALIKTGRSSGLQIAKMLWKRSKSLPLSCLVGTKFATVLDMGQLMRAARPVRRDVIF